MEDVGFLTEMVQNMGAPVEMPSSLSKTGSPRPAGTPIAVITTTRQAVALPANGIQSLQHSLRYSGIGAANSIGLGLRPKLIRIR